MIIFWTIFLLFIIAMLALDLGLFHKDDKEINTKEALIWTGVWILISLFFSILVYFIYESQQMGHGREMVLEYLTCYTIEKALSLDNIFVMFAIFNFFKIPRIYQHRVLFWGILGAIVLRAGFIFAGTALIYRFSWLMYVFGALLLISAIKMAFQKNDDSQDISQNLVVKMFKKIFPVTDQIQGHHFIIKINEIRHLSPLFLALLVIEASDILFALDSIPAIFSISLDPFIIFTSNIMAILGLRSLYFALAAMVNQFIYLKHSLIFILAFVGLKMILASIFTISTIHSLLIILVALLLGVLFSLFMSTQDTP